MAERQSQRKSGGERKKGRNLAWCSRYKSMGTMEKNKVRKFRQHLKRTKQFGVLERIKDRRDWQGIRNELGI